MINWEEIAKEQAYTIARCYWELEAFLHGRNQDRGVLQSVNLEELRKAKHKAAVLGLYGNASGDYMETDLA